MRAIRQGILIIGFGTTIANYPIHVQAASEEPFEWSFSLADQLMYDSNIYRIPDGVDISLLAGPDASREELINRISAGIDGTWTHSRQTVSISLLADDNRLENNENLDYSSTKDRLQWDWVLGRRLSGIVRGDYSRSLVNFANTRVLDRDILESGSYSGEMLYRLGTGWSLKASARKGEVDHSLSVRQAENLDSSTFTGGAQYKTASDNLFGWDYRYVDARFPDDQNSVGNGRSTRDYIERGALAHFKYVVSPKTSFDGNAGYLKREFDFNSDSDFSGDVWRANFRWAPDIKLQVALSAWNELQAHQDAESDYFIARGAGLDVTWLVRETMVLSLESSRARQKYLLANGIAGADSRRDTVEHAQTTLFYRPMHWVQLNLSLGLDHRESNRFTATHDAWFAGTGVKLEF